jgi:O-antigen/teichoic acid export membrane protein
MLGFLATPSDVGIYTAASRTSNLVLLALTAVNALAAPLIADLFARGEVKELQRVATGVVHLAFWPSLVLAGALLLAAPLVLGMFGGEFVLARDALTILVLANLVSVGVGSVGYLMNMTGNQNLMATVVGAAALLNIVFNLLAIPRFGVAGAAAATGISVAFWNLGLNAAVKRRVGVRPSIVHAVGRLLRSA